MVKKLSYIILFSSISLFFPNPAQANVFSKVVLTIFAVPVGAVAGAIRGSGSKAREYSCAFTEAAGGGVLGHTIGVPTGVVVGAATGAVTGAAKGAYKGLTITRKKPAPKPKKPISNSFDFLTNVLQKAPYQFLPML